MKSDLPKVSVIIPNYNHAPYLPQRIDSVLNQTFTDFEVILMDDCSTDHSVDILKSYAAKDARIRLALNTENTGSTFAQWNKGVSLAQGEYIWLAESDDYCDETLLEKLVPLLDKNANVGIAYAQSTIVNEKSEPINSYNENYKFIYGSSEKWERDFIINGQEECANYLVFSNTIPNASGALMRKSVYQLCGGAETGWRLNGDWFFYIKMLIKSDLAYIAEHLNYFRMHQQTQRHKATANHVVFDEIIYTLEYLDRNVDVNPETLNKAFSNVASWWGGSLTRQKFSKQYLRENWRLYRYFNKKRPRLAFSIVWHSIFNFILKVLDFLRLRKPLKKARAKLFPGKYFDY